MQRLIDFLEQSPTAYHAVKNAKALLEQNGFLPLKETAVWKIEKGGKYYVERNAGALIAFSLGEENDSFKIVASHADSPALKLKENALIDKGDYKTLNVEAYGGGIWYSFFDRPLKIAGRVFVETPEGGEEKIVTSSYTVTIPSLAIHQNRDVNSLFAIDDQIDLQPLLTIGGEKDFLSALCEGKILSYDLFLTNAERAYVFGLNDEFISSPRIDNLTSVYSSLTAILSQTSKKGVSVAVIFDNEEVGSLTYQGAGSDFLQNTLLKISYSLGKTEEEHLCALASSFMISLDNAHAKHPNHPEKSDPTNNTLLGKGVVIKSHAKKSYVTDAKSSAIIKRIFEKANVPYQTFFNRSGAKSGGTLGAISLSQVGVLSVDLGIAQLAMHSAVECFAKEDYSALVKGLTAFYSSSSHYTDNGFTIE